MKKKIQCILLVDDDETTNFLNMHLINKNQVAEHVEVTLNGQQALNYINDCLETTGKPDGPPLPDLILLDINMPVMDGWEFLEQYEKLPLAGSGAPTVICMLTTSLSEKDHQKISISKYITGIIPKPMSQGTLEKIVALRMCAEM